MRYANNRKVWLNLRDAFPHPYSQASAQAFLEMVGRQDPITYFAIATREEAIGSIGVSLHRDVQRLTAELGSSLAEPFWGKGIMTEAVARFTGYAFECFGWYGSTRNRTPTMPLRAGYWRRPDMFWRAG